MDKYDEIRLRVIKEAMNDQIVFGQAKPIPSYFTVEDWLSFTTLITEYDIERYPNAKKAAELKNSKLYKALK